MCGEKGVRSASAETYLGSPPHVRGKDAFVLGNMADGGITPACAGKSRFRGRCGHGDGDHPRMCGEKSVIGSRNDTATGSPPHVRGKERRKGRGSHEKGITPACAGKRRQCHARQVCQEDHPRMCGEKLGRLFLLGHIVWITPACAGKSKLEVWAR